MTQPAADPSVGDGFEWQCRMRSRLVELYEAATPTDVFDVAWRIVEREAGCNAAGLWQRDSDAQMFTRAHWGFSDRLARVRLGKMDSGIGEVVMETGAPLLVEDVSAVPDPLVQYPILRAFERSAFSEMGMRSALILPAATDYAVTLLFRHCPNLTQQRVSVLQEFADHFVAAAKRAHERLVNASLVRMAEVLSASSSITCETMDQVARMTRDMVSAGGVSIFLTAANGRALELAGTTGIVGVDGPQQYRLVTYPLEAGEAFTSDVFLKGRPVRWPDLQHPLSRERLGARGYVWRHRHNEVETYEGQASLAIMMVPLQYTYEDPLTGNERVEKVGVIRAAIRREPHLYFSRAEEEAFARVASILGKHVGALRRAGAESLDAMQRIAHQFVAPLNALVWAVERLRTPHLLASLGPDDRSEVAETVRDLALVAASYGQNFELVRRLWAGNPDEFRLTPTYLVAVAIGTARRYRQMARGSEMRVWAAGAGEEGDVHDVGKVMMDEQAFNHALVNILDNAVKYGQPGSEIRLTAGRTVSGQVALYVSSVSRVPVLPSDVSRMCEKGWRSEAARRLLVAGTGTGLWLGKEIMRRHGGDLVPEPSTEEPDGYHVTFALILDPAPQSASGMMRAVRTKE